jgi:hypothetical protein
MTPEQAARLFSDPLTARSGFVRTTGKGLLQPGPEAGAATRAEAKPLRRKFFPRDYHRLANCMVAGQRLTVNLMQINMCP